MSGRSSLIPASPATGPTSATRKAGLRLDTREGLEAELGDGIPLIVPGKPDESELIFRVEVDDDTLPHAAAGVPRSRP